MRDRNKRKYEGRNKNSEQSSSSAENSPEEKKRYLLPGLGLTLPPELIEDEPNEEEMERKIDLVLSKVDVLQKTIADLQHQNTVLTQMVSAMQQQSTKLTEENANLRTRLEKIEEAQKTQRTAGASGGDSFQDSFQTFLQVQKESEEQELKKPNFVIYGLKENQESRSDEEIVKELYVKAEADFLTISGIERMGKANDKYPRLVKVKTTSQSEKIKVMKKQQEVMLEIPEFKMNIVTTYSKYLRDDLTGYQRDLYRKLKDERIRRNESVEAGFRWTVFNFQLIKRRIREDF